MKDHSCSGEDASSVIEFLTNFKRSCDSTRIHEKVALWHFREFMNGPAPATIKARLKSPSNNVNTRQESITSYAEVFNHLLRLRATDTAIAIAYDRIRNFKQGNLIPWDFPQKLWDLTLCCGGIY